MNNRPFFISVETLRDIGNINEVILFLCITGLVSQSEDGCAHIGKPQREELCDELGVTSFTSVNRMLHNLIDKGYLVRLRKTVYTIPDDKRICAPDDGGIPF